MQKFAYNIVRYGGHAQEAIIELRIPWTDWDRSMRDEPPQMVAIRKWMQDAEDNLLDVVDFCIARIEPDDSDGADALAELEEALSVGGSVWTLGANGLTHRVEAAAQEAFEQATHPDDAASTELETAWTCAYGRHPDASDAWDHTIKALENVLCSRVCPSASKPTLGTVRDELRKPELWERGRYALILEVREGSKSPGGVLTEALQAIWPNPDRHGTGEGREPTLEAARAIVHLGITVVQWVRAGVLLVDHSK